MRFQLRGHFVESPQVGPDTARPDGGRMAAALLAYHLLALQPPSFRHQNHEQPSITPQPVRVALDLLNGQDVPDLRLHDDPRLAGIAPPVLTIRPSKFFAAYLA